MAEEKKTRSKKPRAQASWERAYQGGELITVPKVGELVTPELLMTQFHSNYTQCTALKKKGIKRQLDVTEAVMKKEVLSSRQEWNTALTALLQKEEALKEVLEGSGCQCPDSLLGVPAQQLDQMERLTFWARMMLANKHRPVSVPVSIIQGLVEDVTVLKQKVKKSEARLEALSKELVAAGARHQGNLVDVVTHNSPAFDLQAVLAKNAYNPPFDHNDVYHFFPELEDVVKFHVTLQDKCVQECCVPSWPLFQSTCFDALSTLQADTLMGHLSHGCYIGLVVLTNLEDHADGNDVVNYDSMCVSVEQQLTGTSLLPGKKYVTWYLGQYDKDNTMGSGWVNVMDNLFYSVQHAPAAWNQECVTGWRHTLQSTSYKQWYANVLPGVKEVTRDTWGTTDTLDWIARSVNFWAVQLGCYAPRGYNLPLNHHFHRSLFLDTPGLCKFPVLWQFKKSLAELLKSVTEKHGHFKRYKDLVAGYCTNMKREFVACNFNFVFYQWEQVKEMLGKAKAELTEFAQEKKKLSVLMDTVHLSVPAKLCQASALASLFRLDVSEAVNRYQEELNGLFVQATGLLQAVEAEVCTVSVSAEDMEALAEYKRDLEFSSRQWVQEVCGEVLLEPARFWTDFALVKKRVKASRNSHHPDKATSVDPDLVHYHRFQSWVMQLNAIEKLQDHFFSKCVE